MKQFYHVIFLLYLFSYVEISPAFKLDYSLEENDDPSLYNNRIPDPEESVNNNRIDSDESNDNNEIDKPPGRSNRFFGPAIALLGNVAFKVAGNLIGDQLNKLFHRSSRFQRPTTMTDINTNYNVADRFKNDIASMNPQAASSILVNKNGFICDTNFCRRYGNGRHSFGICSPVICHCSNGNAFEEICESGTVYDPMTTSCNLRANVEICGA